MRAFGTELYIFIFLLNLLVSVGNKAQAIVFRLLVTDVAPECDKSLTGSGLRSLDPDEHLMFLREFQKLGMDLNELQDLPRDLDVWVSRLGSRSGSLSVCVLVPV